MTLDRVTHLYWFGPDHSPLLGQFNALIPQKLRPGTKLLLAFPFNDADKKLPALFDPKQFQELHRDTRIGSELILEKLNPAAGLEESRPRDVELFANEHLDQIPNIPKGTGRILTVPLQTTVTFYSPDTLAAGLEELISREQKDLPGLAVERKPAPSSADQVQRPSVFVWDTLLVLPYDPGIPVVRHQLGQPFHYRLLQLVALAHLGSEAAGYQILAAWTYDREGRTVLAIALYA